MQYQHMVFLDFCFDISIVGFSSLLGCNFFILDTYFSSHFCISSTTITTNCRRQVAGGILLRALGPGPGRRRKGEPVTLQP